MPANNHSAALPEFMYRFRTQLVWQLDIRWDQLNKFVLQHVVIAPKAATPIEPPI